MTLHLQKLCVGVDSIEDLERWIAYRRDQKRRAGLADEQIHTTRMMPKNVDALLDGGSLYWVIKGTMQARQRLLDIRRIRDDDGIKRCELVLEPVVIPTVPRPRRPFQGWRYLKPDEAPPDIGGPGGGDNADLPAKMRNDLADLGLI